jgi:hypothetical protein
VVNIKIDLNEIEYEGMNWINLAQDKDKWLAAVITATSLPAS